MDRWLSDVISWLSINRNLQIPDLVIIQDSMVLSLERVDEHLMDHVQLKQIFRELN